MVSSSCFNLVLASMVSSSCFNLVLVFCGPFNRVGSFLSLVDGSLVYNFLCEASKFDNSKSFLSCSVTFLYLVINVYKFYSICPSGLKFLKSKSDPLEEVLSPSLLSGIASLYRRSAIFLDRGLIEDLIIASRINYFRMKRVISNSFSIRRSPTSLQRCSILSRGLL
jgi:hypothetical protein